jgi:TolB protein
MARSPVALTSAFLLLIAACTGADGQPGTSMPATTPLTTATSSGEIPGRLVVLDSSGNVVTVDPDGSSPTPITNDAGDAVVYTQPLWSPDSSRLAWGEQSAGGVAVEVASPDGTGASETAMSAPPFYLYWSPDGEKLGVLHNGIEGIELEIVDVEAGTAEVVAGGTPLYFSWSPGSERLVAHVGPDLVTIGLDGASAQAGPTEPGYAAPHWTGEGIFHLGPGGVELLGTEGAATVLATVRGPVALVANRQGDLLALQMYADEDSGISATLSDAPLLPANSVAVLDVASKEVTEVSDGLSAGFFWSPDGRKLLVLDPTGEPGRADVLVWDGESTSSQFTLDPHPLIIRDVLRFFDQYSQSHQLWSPDSAAFVLAGEVEGETGIWVQRVGAEAPTKVLDGTWAAWSNGAGR